MNIPKTKTFQGKRFQLRGAYESPTLAKNVADGFKKRGWNVRVVELTRWMKWGVYIRRASIHSVTKRRRRG